MRPTLWLAVKRSLGEALRQPHERRESFVRERCAETDVREEVLRLLRWRDRHHGAADQSVGGAATEPPGAGTIADGGATADAIRCSTDVRPAAVGPRAVINGRYVLGDELGAGAFGTVHTARDRVTGRRVAVKTIVLRGEQELRAMRREIAVLRRSRLPGIVELLDDGIEDGRAHLVMRLVEGRPFPGALQSLSADGTARWEEIARRAASLVEALGRLHWLGVLHRDLKPDNVLVDQSGEVTIVDLGTARPLEDTGESAVCYLVGTPTYLAPERLDGSPATRSSDLYAVGAILYEALGGRPPREADSIGELIRRRSESAAPLESVARGVPRHVAETIDALVHVDPARRPRSARVVAAMLRGEGEQGARVRLPWTGSDAAVVAVTQTVKAGRPLDLAGPAGCGRSRTLAEAERRLTTDGYRVVRTVPAAAPFASLLPLVGTMPGVPGWTTDDTGAWLRRCLGSWLGVHVALFADDWDRIDAHSRAVLEAVRDFGPLVRVLGAGAPGAVEPAPRTEHDLRALFQGPDRSFHLREDGARELHRRTGGRPGELVREIEAWIDAGIARWENDLVVIDRAGIERLETCVPASLPRCSPPPPGLPASALDVAAALEIAGCAVAVDVLAHALGAPVAQVETDVGRLAECCVARLDGAGHAVAQLSLGAASSWHADRRNRLHAAVADTLPAATGRRLVHLLLSGQRARFTSEALDAARCCLDQGNVERAFALVAEVTSIVRHTEPADDEILDRAALLLLDTALALGTPSAIGRVAAEFESTPCESVTWNVCAAICEAAALAIGGAPDRSLAALRALGDPGDPRLQIRALTVGSVAARRAADHFAELDVLREGARIARSDRHGAGRGLFRDWLAWLRYREHRFTVAAALHTRAARHMPTVRGRVLSMTNAASSFLQAGELAAAKAWAERALRLASHARIGPAEARAEWLLRRVLHRSETHLAPDLELVAAVRGTVDPHLESMICSEEASIALHAGQALTASVLAARAQLVAEETGRTTIAQIAAGLQAAAASPDSWRAAERSFAAAGEWLPGPTGIETVALCAPCVPAPDAAVVERALRSLPANHPPGARTYDILTDDEVVARLRAAQQEP